MSADDHTERISVSRDALRADLAELKLDLQDFMLEQLKHKADAAPFVVLQLAVEQFLRGEFNKAQTGAIEDLIENHVSQRAEHGWARSTQFGQLIAAAAGAATFLVYALILKHSGAL